MGYVDGCNLSPAIEALFEKMKPLRVYNGEITFPKGSPVGEGNVIFLMNPSREMSYEFLGDESIDLRKSYKWYAIDTIYRKKIGNKKIIENLSTTLRKEYNESRINKQVAFATSSTKKDLIENRKNHVCDLSQWMNYYFLYRRIRKYDYCCEDFARFISELIITEEYMDFNKILVIDMDRWAESPAGGYRYKKVEDLNNPLSLFMAIARNNEEAFTVYGDAVLYILSAKNKKSIMIPMKELTQKNLKLISGRLSNWIPENEVEENVLSSLIDEGMDDIKIAKRVVIINTLRNNFVGEVEDVTAYTEVDDAVSDSQREDDADNQFFADIEAEANQYINEHPEVLNVEDGDEAEVADAIQQYISKKYMTRHITPKQDEKYKSVVDKLSKDQKNIVPQVFNHDIKSKTIDVTDMSDYIQTNNEALTHSKFVNFDKNYMDKKFEPQIDACIAALSTAEYPLFITSKMVEDTSDSLNLKKTYTYELADPDGKKHVLKFDIPTIIDNNYIYIGGSKKVVGHQLVLKPIVKIAPDTLELVSWYNKIFMYRSSNSTVDSTNLLKYVLQNDKEFSARIGNTTMKNRSYVTTIDFEGIAKKLYEFKVGDCVFITELDKMYEYYVTQSKAAKKKVKANDKSHPVIGYNTKTNEPIILSNGDSYASYIIKLLDENQLAQFRKYKVGKRNNMITMKINGSKIPAVLFLLYCEGFKSLMERAKIEYKVIDKKELKDYHPQDWGSIFLTDCVVVWKRSPIENSLLMDGLQSINLEIYSLEELEDAATYVNILSNFYGSATCGYFLAQFKDFMIDDTMKEILEDHNLPTNLTDLILYAVLLLSTNNYLTENHMSNMRVRSNELIPALLYKRITTAYMKYRRTAYKKKPTKVSVPQNVVIKAMMSDEDNASKLIEEASVLNPILTIEKARSVTYKGPNGINLENSISLQVRGYDESMLGALAMVTPNDGNVGIVRQLTLEPNITSTLGYIDVKGREGLDDMNQANLLAPAEMITPLSYQHDDPTRTAIAYVVAVKLCELQRCFRKTY